MATKNAAIASYSFTPHTKREWTTLPDSAGPTPYEYTEYIEVKASIKIWVDGKYLVRAGFYKHGKFITGYFTGTKYYVDKRISGKAGDVVNVELKLKDSPPLTTNTHIEVYDI